MPTSPTLVLFEHFKSVEDPRMERTKDHVLLDMIVIAVYAVICGADDWVGIEAWGMKKWHGCANLWRYRTGYPHTTPLGGCSVGLTRKPFKRRLR